MKLANIYQLYQMDIRIKKRKACNYVIFTPNKDVTLLLSGKKLHTAQQL